MPQKTIGTSAVAIAVADLDGCDVLAHNKEAGGGHSIWIEVGTHAAASAVTTSSTHAGFELAPGEAVTFHVGPQEEAWAISDAAGKRLDLLRDGYNGT